MRIMYLLVVWNQQSRGSEIPELLNCSAPLFSSERISPYLEREIKKFRVHSDPKEHQEWAKDSGLRTIRRGGAEHNPGDRLLLVELGSQEVGESFN